MNPLAIIDIGNPILWLIGLPAVGMVFLLMHARYSAETRERRRRERSHRRVISRKQGPTVKLAVKADKSKRSRHK